MTLIKITKKKLLVLVGALIALSPFLGLPGLAKSIIIVILGLSVAIVALVNGEKKLCECENCVPKTKPGSYVENVPSVASTGTIKMEKGKKPDLSAALHPAQTGKNASSPIRI